MDMLRKLIPSHWVSRLLVTFFAVVVWTALTIGLAVTPEATWAMTLAPGLLLLALSAAARRHWWRWLVLWFLVATSFGDFAVVTLLAGMTWVVFRVWQDATSAKVVGHAPPPVGKAKLLNRDGPHKSSRRGRKKEQDAKR